MYKNEAHKKYAAPPAPGNPREVEAWAMTQAALRMMGAKEQNDRDAMLEATRLNWRLWTIIQADLLDPECAVPDEIRSNMISLANFVDKHTVAFIRQPKADDLEVLININREIAGGLYARPDVPAGPTPDAPTPPPQKSTTA